LELGRCVLQPGSATARAVQLISRRFGTAAVLGSLLAGAVAGCSHPARATRLPSEGTAPVYQIDCRTKVESCRDKAAEVCAGPYEVIESTGAPIEPPRVDTAPGPRSTGPQYQHPDWAGRLVVACRSTSENSELEAHEGLRRSEGPAPVTAAPAPVTAPPAAAAPQLAPNQICVPGVTQACLGPGACRGAQACLADGRGYGVCDCGTAAPSAPPPSQ
jgi:hypothetical protein